MSKHSKSNTIVNWWNKFMESNILPIVWGVITVISITAVLASVGIVAVRWFLTLVGVIV